jgi:hypothetical protein
MATAAFSMPSDPRARISISGRSKNPGSATSAAADEALRQIIDRRRRKNKYGSEPERRESALGGAIGSVSDTIGESVARLGPVRWILTVTVLLAVGGVLFAGALMARPKCMAHPAVGIARAGKTPLVGAQIRLHPRGMALPDDAVPTATVQADGTFALTTFTKGDGAPPGDYVVTVQWFRVAKDGSVGGNSLPKRYASPTTSPLSVTIREGKNDLPPFTFHR